MSNSALSLYLRRHLTFQNASLQKAFALSEEGDASLIDSLLKRNLLTYEQYKILSHLFQNARRAYEGDSLENVPVTSLLEAAHSERTFTNNLVFQDAILAVERAFTNPDLLNDLPKSQDDLPAFVSLSELDVLEDEVEETLAQVYFDSVWEEEETEEHTKKTLPPSPEPANLDTETVQVEAPVRKGMLAGRTLSGRWLLNELVGEGAMGVVYECIDLHHGGRAAVKILRPIFQRSEEILNRFKREVEILQSLSHPNILNVFELSVDPKLGVYMVMEILEGCDLDQFLQHYEYEIPVEELMFVLEQICDALESVHEREIVHRDLKPENIFLTELPQGFKHATLIDFGIARMDTPDGVPFTMAGATLGTPQYISPEQAVGGDLDRRSDLYSLAVIVFKSLSGRDLFDAQSPLEYLHNHIHTPAPRLSSVIPDKAVPRSLDKVLAKALAKKKEERYDSVRAFQGPLLEALEEYRKNLTQTETKGVFSLLKSWSVRVFSQ